MYAYPARAMISYLRYIFNRAGINKPNGLLRPIATTTAKSPRAQFEGSFVKPFYYSIAQI